MSAPTDPADYDACDEHEQAYPRGEACPECVSPPSRGPDMAAIASANRFHAFMRGWRHAAAGKAKDPKHVEHATLAEPYHAGYESGRAAFCSAVDAASERFGHVPSPFRGEPTP